MGEPRRHSSSSRSRRKSLRQAGRVQGELEYVAKMLRKLVGHLEYAIRKSDKLQNRIR